METHDSLTFNCEFNFEMKNYDNINSNHCNLDDDFKDNRKQNNTKLLLGLLKYDYQRH